MARFDYPRMIHEALRGVVRLALTEVAEDGLEGDHHFYVGFRTDHPGVRMPGFLQKLHPEEITIILQNQFWDLVVEEDAFAVTLTFDGRRHRITVPFAAIESFADPGAPFGLRFDVPPAAVQTAPVAGAPTTAQGDAAPDPGEDGEARRFGPGRGKGPPAARPEVEAGEEPGGEAPAEAGGTAASGGEPDHPAEEKPGGVVRLEDFRKGKGRKDPPPAED